MEEDTPDSIYRIYCDPGRGAKSYIDGFLEGIYYGCCWTRKSNILRVVGHGSENKNGIVHNSNYKRSPVFSCYFTAVLSLQLLTILKGRWHYPIYTDELTQGRLVTFPRQLLCGGFETRALVF